jgi:hypothetical protein
MALLVPETGLLLLFPSYTVSGLLQRACLLVQHRVHALEILIS